MGQAIEKKLDNTQGASMLIALLFFLVAMMVGAVVLTAAFTNAGRVTRNRQEQQKYLAVASAAELVKEDIFSAPGGSFTGGYRKIVTETVYTHSSTDPVTGEVTTWTTTEYDTDYQEETPITDNSLFLPEIKDLLNTIYFTTVPEGTGLRKAWTPTTDVDVELDFGAADMPTVVGSLKVSPDNNSTTGQRRYALTAVLGVKPEQEGDPSSYVSTMEFAPSVTERVQADEPVAVGNITTYITHYITTVTWGTPVITKGAEL